MGREIEAKFRLSDPDQLRTRLRETCAARLRRVFEISRIFDTSNRRLLNAGCGLRIREWRSLDSDGAAGTTLTFKGPREAGEFKSREEIETDLADAAAAIAILQRLGFSEVITYEKRRETWRLGECEVTIDELPQLGWYAEVEGPSAKAVEAGRRQLDLADCPPVSETYVELAATHGDADASGGRRLAFDA